ncbi:MAG TPA: glycoside hydrolase family 25 protein [Verrucomicrobiae bacterium]|nr:glycoside hydrolase family 25 protein [Verrucomicrobiae bacterium]
MSFSNEVRGLRAGNTFHFCVGIWLCLFGADPAIDAASRDLGLDVSHYNGSTGIPQSTWNQIHGDAKRFTFIKATEGLTGPDDATMVNNATRATAAGLLAGVYHVAHAENRPTTNGAIQEADHFLGYAGSRIGPGFLRPVLDLEQNNTVLTPGALTDWIIAFSNEISTQRGAGAVPIIYLGRSSANSAVDSRLAAYDLWLAYPTDVDPLTASPPPTASYPNPTGVFNNWSFWQYSWTGTAGGLSNVDLDVCHDEYKPVSAYIIPTPAANFNLGNMSLRPGGFGFSFTNVPGTHFSVVASTNAAAPLNGWTVLGFAVEGPSGVFHFTDTNSANRPRTFYRVRSP